jgi:hypothetical protein
MMTKNEKKTAIAETKVVRTAYGFFPQMKAESIAFKKERSSAIVIGTNPGFQNGVLIVDEITTKTNRNEVDWNDSGSPNTENK